MIGNDLAELRELMDRIESLNTQLASLKKQRAAVEARIKRQAESDGLTSYSSDNITVSVRDDLVAGYDPDHWPELIRWAVSTNNEHVIQRRLSTKPICEIAANGTPLPDFIRLESVTRLNVRRK